jgi:hypothetical protein
MAIGNNQGKDLFGKAQEAQTRAGKELQKEEKEKTRTRMTLSSSL